MKNVTLVGLVFKQFLMSGLAVAQVQTQGTAEPASVQQIETVAYLEILEEEKTVEKKKINKNQIALDVGGELIYSLSYVRRVGGTNLSLGGRLGFGWEFNSHSFDRNIWEAPHVEIFARYQPFQGLQLDSGPTLMSYIYTDDCSECTGTFLGIYLAAGVGYGPLFVGPWVRIGSADDRRHGSEFGTIWSIHVRLALSWGK